MNRQKILVATRDYEELDGWLEENGTKKVFLVCDLSLQLLRIREYFDGLEGRTGVKVIRYDGFQPNPLYESVVKGEELFHGENCDSIIAVGGGSAIDVAKCIKLYSNMDSGKNYLQQEITPNNIPFLAMPTTAGTGSEATRYAVIYYEGAKLSVTDDSCIPGTVLMDSSTLKTLPIYQRKSTMMDALCHAIESFWSVNSTDESKEHAKNAIQMIMAHMDGYLANDEEANKKMLLAANAAGKAINITQTTAGHAMCYKMTSLYGVAHGHAVILCNRILFPWMVKNVNRCIDPRGGEYLKGVFGQIAEAMGCGNAEEATGELEEIFQKLELDIPKAKKEDYEILKRAVNPVRLKNHPILLDVDVIDMLYHMILGGLGGL